MTTVRRPSQRSTTRSWRGSRTPASTPARRASSAGSTAGWFGSRPARPSARAASRRSRRTARHRREARALPAALRRRRPARRSCASRRSPSRAGLDRHLGARGMERIDDTRVMVLASLDAFVAAGRSPCRRGAIETADAAAFAEWVGLARGSSPLERRAHAERIAAAPLPHHVVLARDERGEVVACAQVVIEGDVAGLYDVFTAESARGRGYAEQALPASARPCRDRGRAGRLPAGRRRQRCGARASIAGSASSTATPTTTGRRRRRVLRGRRARGRCLRRGRGACSSTAPRRRSRPCRGCRAGTSAAPASRSRTRTGRRGWCRCTPGRRSSRRPSVAASPSGMTRTKRSPA